MPCPTPGARSDRTCAISARSIMDLARKTCIIQDVPMLDLNSLQDVASLVSLTHPRVLESGGGGGLAAFEGVDGGEEEFIRIHERDRRRGGGWQGN